MQVDGDTTTHETSGEKHSGKPRRQHRQQQGREQNGRENFIRVPAIEKQKKHTNNRRTGPLAWGCLKEWINAPDTPSTKLNFTVEIPFVSVQKDKHVLAPSLQQAISPSKHTLR